MDVVSYGRDCLDPSNLLGVWISTGCHTWLDHGFGWVGEAGSLAGDPERRDRMFRDTREIPVDDAVGTFIAHRWQGNLIQPWLQGEAIREPDYGIAGFHWDNDTAISNLYPSNIKEH